MSDQSESPFGAGADQDYYPDPNSPFTGSRHSSSGDRTKLPKRLLIAAVAAVSVVALGLGGVMLASSGGSSDPAPSPTSAPNPLPTSESPPSIAMPDLIGLSLPDAAAAVESVGLVVAEVTEQPGGGESGNVLTQSPPAGTTLNPGDPVSLVIASAASVPVPDVKGLARDAAEQAITEAGLVVGTVTERSSSQPPFTVMRQSPASGTPAPAGSVVDLIVADTSTRIPDVVGMFGADATEILEARGLKVRQRAEPSRKDPGTVLSVRPKVGTVVDAGTRVTLTVAS